MADTLADLKSLIADDLARTDLTSQIANEIANAIRLHQAERFYFNEDRSLSFNTVASQEFYTSADNASIPNLYEIDSIRMTVNGTRYQIDQEVYSTIDQISTLASSTGYPSIYARYGQQLRFYPIPNGTYATVVSAHVILPALVADASANAWTTMADGGNLIRYAAEERLYRTVIKARDAAADAGYARDQELLRLRDETGRRTSSGQIEPMSW